MSIWDAPIELANTVYTFAYVALVVGAVMTAVSTMSLFWASALRDRYADGQIQAARLDAAHATENAGVARVAAALATERGNALAVEAEEARTQQAQLQLDVEREKTARAAFEAQFSWRIIDDKVRATLLRELAKSPHTIAIEYPPADQEASFLAIQFITIFKEAKWTVIPRATPSPPLTFGLDVPGPQNEATKALLDAFGVAGIKPGTADLPIPGMFMGDPSQSSLTPDCRLVVGAKPTAEVVRALAQMQHQ